MTCSFQVVSVSYNVVYIFVAYQLVIVISQPGVFNEKNAIINAILNTNLKKLNSPPKYMLVEKECFSTLHSTFAPPKLILAGVIFYLVDVIFIFRFLSFSFISCFLNYIFMEIAYIGVFSLKKHKLNDYIVMVTR